MPGGRPTKYTQELLEKAKQYLDEYENLGDVIPSQVGLCAWLEITRSTLHKWENDEDKPEFSSILDKILSEQQRVLLNKGLTGDFNSAITKLVLGKHGFHEKSDQTLSGPGGGPVQTDNAWYVEVVESD